MVRGTIHDPLNGQSKEVIAAKQWAPVEEFHKKKRMELEERRAQRSADGCRGGGHNERREATIDDRGTPQSQEREVDEGGYDDFGRRIRGAGQSKADRAASALERLRQKSSTAKVLDGDQVEVEVDTRDADAFLRTGRGSESGAMSEEARNVLSAFLHHTGTESDKFVVVLATNIRDILDRAVLDRIDESFEFPLPSLTERQRMLGMFMNEHIHKPTKKGKVIE
ncbi:unnamed protein product, partial [Polarella glacialis]